MSNTNPLLEIKKYGQSIWYDNLSRALLKSGDIKKLIDDGEVVGLTSNPAIFAKAITGSDDYDDAMAVLLKDDPNISIHDLYESLAIEDIRTVADLLTPVYQQTNGIDGYVSIEVNPHLADDTEGTIKEARHLFNSINRPNLMIKVPATKEGLPAISTLIGEGINVNVTLMFSLQDYIDVADAYLTGLEKLAATGGDLSKVASVASFFVSRVDSQVDKQLSADSPWRGKTGIANSKAAYDKYREVYASGRFAALKEKGARPQRLLWASTGVKNPDYSDVLYMDELIGQETVNTAPPATIDAFRDHGNPRSSLAENLDQAYQVLDGIKQEGIDLDAVTAKLKEDGVVLFQEPFDKLMAALTEKKAKMVG